MVNFISSKFTEFLPTAQACFIPEYSSDIYQSYLTRSLAQRRVTTTQPSSHPKTDIRIHRSIYLRAQLTSFALPSQKFYHPPKISSFMLSSPLYKSCSLSCQKSDFPLKPPSFLPFSAAISFSHQCGAILLHQMRRLPPALPMHSMHDQY